MQTRRGVSMQLPERMEILVDSFGTLIHDCFSPYFKLTNLDHAICLQHIQRELRAATIREKGEAGYFKDLEAFLLEMRKAKMDAIEAGTVTPVPQGDSGTHYAKMLRKEMGNIDWTKSAEEIGRLVRGLNPWPSAYTHWNGKMLKIWMAEPVTQEELSALGCDEKNGMDLKEAQPGTVMIVTKDTLMVQTGDGLLALTELQMEGKKRMPVQAFLMGCRLQTGEKLERIGRY